MWEYALRQAIKSKTDSPDLQVTENDGAESYCREVGGLIQEFFLYKNMQF